MSLAQEQLKKKLRDMRIMKGEQKVVQDALSTVITYKTQAIRTKYSYKTYCIKAFGKFKPMSSLKLYELSELKELIGKDLMEVNDV